MNHKKRILMIVLILIFLFVIGAYLYINHISNRGIPDYNQNITLSNLIQQVIVYRDNYGIPHIYAKNEEDLYRATGYIMAQDRLWQMDVMRRLTTGCLAEIMGKELVESDLLMRALGMTKKSQLILETLDPKIIKAAEAFTDGINQFLRQNRKQLPVEFTILGYQPEEWQVTHSFNLLSFMSWSLSFSWSTEVLLQQIKLLIPEVKFKEMLPQLSRHEPAIYPGFFLPDPGQIKDPSQMNKTLLTGAKKIQEMGLAVFQASNNWVVSGKKSVTGKPILANDMHLNLFIPGIWYQIHQVVEDGLNVTGVAIPGQPFVISGHNEHIAWGMTNVMVDDMDFYLELINPQNTNQYKFNDQWHEMERQPETIKIKGGNVIEETLRFTHRGPVISQFKKISDKVISMRWIGNEFSNEVKGVYLLNRATNWPQFKEAVKTFTSISQNIIYADIDGNIGLQTCAGVPIRKRDGLFFLPGETDKYDWTGFVPFEKLPYRFNPECGYISSANNKTVPKNYPFHISHWFDLPHRNNRIREMLAAKEKLTSEDFQKMQRDVKSKHVTLFLPDILEILDKAKDFNGLERKAHHLLKNWDAVLTSDSSAATLFETMFVVMLEHLTKDELGKKLFHEYLGFNILVENLILNIWEKKDSPWIDNINTTKKENFNDWILGSFRASVRRLNKQFGSQIEQWQWGKLHRLRLNHPLGRVKLLDFLFDLNLDPIAIEGSYHTVNSIHYLYNNPFESQYGPSQRHIYSLADWDKSLSVIPTGTSGIPSSPYYCDQTKLYKNNKYHNDYMTREKIIGSATFKMIFMPQQ
jgi:penicillin G amidase